jgi:phage recombination protein Bet
MSVAIQENKNEIEGKVDLIKRLYCKGASNDELELFMHACKRTGLDPFMKQIYAIKRGGQMTIQTGIDGLRLVAERTANYSPGRESTFAYDDKGILLSATSYIKKRTSDGTWHEVAATAYLDEYNAKQGLWNKMPRAMLSKCAEALALRKAFPAEMSGIYTMDEMQQADARQEPMPPVIEENVLATTEQLKELREKLVKIDDIEYLEKLQEFCFETYKVTSFEEINQNQYIEIMKSVNKKFKTLEVA